MPPTCRDDSDEDKDKDEVKEWPRTPAELEMELIDDMPFETVHVPQALCLCPTP